MANLMDFCTGFAEYATHCGVARSRVINSASYPQNWPNGEQTRPLFAELHRIILRGQHKGQISTAHNAMLLTNLIVIMLRGCCFDWARRGGCYDLVESTQNCTRLIVDGMSPLTAELYGAQIPHID